MNLPDILIILAVVLIVGGATAYIIHAKKSGKKCIGCPDSGTCSAGKNGGCGGCSGQCHCHEEET